MTEFHCELLGKQHDRELFQSGAEDLDRWLRQKARQDQDRGVAAVHVFSPASEPSRVAGFYSLSSAALKLSDFPSQISRRLPKYEAVPATLLGRLARGRDFPGLGRQMLFDALNRAWRHSEEIASVAVVVDGRDELAIAFYRKYGFQPIVGNMRRLFLPLRIVPTILPQL